LRERLLSDGARTLRDAELIAILLNGGTRSHTAIEIASHIVRMFGGLTALAATSPRALAQVHGVGPARAARVAAAFELGRRARDLAHDTVRLRTVDDIFAHVAPRLACEPQEMTLVLGLDARDVLIDTVELARGPESSRTPREVFRPHCAWQQPAG
jgi:DNA repair protein RadC